MWNITEIQGAQNHPFISFSTLTFQNSSGHRRNLLRGNFECVRPEFYFTFSLKTFLFLLILAFYLLFAFFLF